MLSNTISKLSEYISSTRPQTEKAACHLHEISSAILPPAKPSYFYYFIIITLLLYNPPILLEYSSQARKLKDRRRQHGLYKIASFFPKFVSKRIFFRGN